MKHSILELVFKTSTDKTFTLQIQNPKLDLTKEIVTKSMEDIIALHVFDVSKGELISIKSAQYIERSTKSVL